MGIEDFAEATRLIRGGLDRSGFDETAEAIYTTSGFVYGSAEEAQAAFAGDVDRYIYGRYGNPTVSDGKIFLGTNNDYPHGDDRFKGDRSLVLCLDEETGKMIWQLNIPKLGTGKVSDWEFLGICSSPTVEGNRVYFVTNRCEVMCLDTEGMANGNDGPFKDEAQYLAGPGNPPMELEDTDADIIWSLNMIDECGVFPHNITSSAVLVAGDKLWVSTSNGVDYGHVETPAPNAPTAPPKRRRFGAAPKR